MKSLSCNKTADERMIKSLVHLCQEVSGMDFHPDRLNIVDGLKDQIRKPEEDLIHEIIPLLDGHTLLEVNHVLKALKIYAKERVYQTKPI